MTAEVCIYTLVQIYPETIVRCKSIPGWLLVIVRRTISLASIEAWMASPLLHNLRLCRVQSTSSKAASSFRLSCVDNQLNRICRSRRTGIHKSVSSSGNNLLFTPFVPCIFKCDKRFSLQISKLLNNWTAAIFWQYISKQFSSTKLVGDLDYYKTCSQSSRNSASKIIKNEAANNVLQHEKM